MIINCNNLYHFYNNKSTRTSILNAQDYSHTRNIFTDVFNLKISHDYNNDMHDSYARKIYWEFV